MKKTVYLPLFVAAIIAIALLTTTPHAQITVNGATTYPALTITNLTATKLLPAGVAPAKGDLLTFSDALGTMTSLVDVAAGSYVRAAGVGSVPIYSTLTLPNTSVAGDIFIASATNVVSSATPASVHASPANQTGNATATFKMNGLGAAAAPCIITPATSGRVQFTISGYAGNTTTLDSVQYKMAESTGAAPANGAALTGTVISATGSFTALTGNLAVPFSITSLVTGLTVGAAVWFDLQVADAAAAGTGQITLVDCTAIEF